MGNSTYNPSQQQMAGRQPSTPNYDSRAAPDRNVYAQQQAQQSYSYEQQQAQMGQQYQQAYNQQPQQQYAPPTPRYAPRAPMYFDSSGAYPMQQMGQRQQQAQQQQAIQALQQQGNAPRQQMGMAAQGYQPQQSRQDLSQWAGNMPAQPQAMPQWRPPQQYDPMGASAPGMGGGQPRQQMGMAPQNYQSQYQPGRYGEMAFNMPAQPQVMSNWFPQQQPQVGPDPYMQQQAIQALQQQRGFMPQQQMRWR
jgi:hypothetical protein